MIDEASMIDLEMMYNVLQALPSHARLILLGDKDQLASVEAGSVLGDLCADAQLAYYSTQTQQQLETLCNEKLQAQPWCVGSAEAAAFSTAHGDADVHGALVPTSALASSRGRLIKAIGKRLCSYLKHRAKMSTIYPCSRTVA